MKLQLALDEMKTEEAIKLVEKVKDYIDIIEVGTPICLDAGNNAVERMKKEFRSEEHTSEQRIPRQRSFSRLQDHGWWLLRN